MKAFRKAWRWAVLGGALAALLLVPAASAMASVTIPQGTQPPLEGTVSVCANGGAGLCLEMLDGALVQNDAFISPTSVDGNLQAWGFTAIGVVTHGKGAGPFSNPNLDQDVTAGRTWGFWTIDTGGLAPLCLDYQAGQIQLAVCNTNNMPTTGTEWVLSGSGRLINVQHSDQEGDLQFLNSSGVNGGTPSLHTGNKCPAACWGPEAG